MNAVEGIASNSVVAGVLKEGSARIVDWFNGNLEAFKAQVVAAEGEGDYALALALVESVPSECEAAYAYAQGAIPDLAGKLMAQHSNETLERMRGAIAQSEGVYTPEVGACLSLLPAGSATQAEGKKLMAQYEQKMEARRKADEAKAREDEAFARHLKEMEMEQTHRKEMEQLKAAQMQAKYEADATKKVLRESRGFWGSLGHKVLDGLDMLSNSLHGKNE